MHKEKQGCTVAVSDRAITIITERMTIPRQAAIVNTPK